MSRLYYNEEGRVIPTLCEELAAFRHARKTLDLEETAGKATVYLLARSYPDNETPLHLSVNGVELDSISPDGSGAYRWHVVEIEADRLRGGKNTFTLWAEPMAMEGWSLALEAGHAQPESAVSDNGGGTWRSERMGYLNAVLGEYVIRVRLEEGEDPAPPPMIWEGENTRLASLRQRVPSAALDAGPTLWRARVLSTWLSSTWEHTNSARASTYGPWDAETLLGWGPKQTGHNGKRPIVMCVHYAAAFVSSAQSIGIPARCAVLTEALNGSNGHFVAEVWEEKLRKWVVVDPNTDALFVKGGVPMSMNEIQDVGSDLGQYVEYGPGSEFQTTFPHIVKFQEENLERGACFGHRSVWFRSDLLGHPEHNPPGHGSISYCETGLVWEKRDLDAGFGMFPYFGDKDYFDAPPVRSSNM